MSKLNIKPQWIDLRIAIAVGLCMLIYRFVPGLQLLSACTAALMCTQDTGKLTVKSGLIRLLTTVLGGAMAVLVVLLDNAIGNYYVFILLCVTGMVVTLNLCRMCGVPPIPGRIGCVTFILVVVVAKGDARIMYAVDRLVATACGATVALAVSWVAQLAFGAGKQPKAV